MVEEELSETTYISGIIPWRSCGNKKVLSKCLAVIQKPVSPQSSFKTAYISDFTDCSLTDTLTRIVFKAILENGQGMKNTIDLKIQYTSKDYLNKKGIYSMSYRYEN